MILLPTDRKRAYLPPQLTHKWEQVSINPLPFKSQMQKMWVFTSGCFSKFCTLLKLILWMVVAYWRWVWTNMSVMSTQLVGNLSIHGQVDSFDMFIAHRQWEKKTTRTRKISFGNKGEIKSSRPKIMMTWQESDWAAERVIFFNERWLSAILILHTTWHIILILISSTDFSSRKFLADEKKIDAVFDHLMSGQQVSKKNYKVLNFNFHKLKWFNGLHSRHYLAAAADYDYYHKNPFLWLHFYSFGLFLLGYLCWQAN